MSQKPDMDHKEWRVTKITEILLTCIYTRSKTNKLQRKFSRGKGNLTDGALKGKEPTMCLLSLELECVMVQVTEV